MNVTILADASHCPDTKAGGYGFWIASARGKKGGSGVLNGAIASSTLAEMMAIANAIHQGIKFGLVQGHDTLLVQTDCESAIFAFTKKRKGSEEEKKVMQFKVIKQNYKRGVISKEMYSKMMASVRDR